MNLTDCDEYSDSSMDVADAHMGVANAYRLAKDSGARGKQLDGFFSSLVDFVKVTNSAPLKLLKTAVTNPTNPSAGIEQIKSDVQAGSKAAAGVTSIIAPIASAFGPIGMAVGAVLKINQAMYEKRAAQANALAQSGAQGQQLVDEYKKIQGQVPGRMVGGDNLKAIVGAFTNAGGYPPIKADTASSPTGQSSWENALRAADAGMKRGALAAEDIYNSEWAALIRTNPQWSWMAGMYVQPGNAQRQLFVDMIDAAMYQLNPQAPFSYGVDYLPPDASAPTQSPQPLPPAPILTTSLPAPPAPLPIAMQSPAPSKTPAPASQALTQSGVNPAVSNDVNAMLAAMQAQGANQAQMLNAAMQALAAKGVNTQIPAVQEAAKADVAQMQTAGISSIPSWVLPLLAGGAIFFALAMPKGKARANRGAFSSRRRNPKRRRGRR